MTRRRGVPVIPRDIRLVYAPEELFESALAADGEVYVPPEADRPRTVEELEVITKRLGVDGGWKEAHLQIRIPKHQELSAYYPRRQLCSTCSLASRIFNQSPFALLDTNSPEVVNWW
jgi:hypothetical protein